MTNVRETVWTLVKKKELECGIRLSFPYPNWRFNIVIDVLNTGRPPSPPRQLILLWQVSRELCRRAIPLTWSNYGYDGLLRRRFLVRHAIQAGTRDSAWEASPGSVPRESSVGAEIRTRIVSHPILSRHATLLPKSK